MPLIDPEYNPCQSPPLSRNATTPRATAWLTAWKTLGRSVVCALAGAAVGLLIGAIVGCFVYPLFPSFFNNTIYSPEDGLGDAYNAKVHIQTCIHFARDGAVYLFWTGLIVPWLFWIKGRINSALAKHAAMPR